jgi:hypothetical protein
VALNSSVRPAICTVIYTFTQLIALWPFVVVGPFKFGGCKEKPR